MLSIESEAIDYPSNKTKLTSAEMEQCNCSERTKGHRNIPFHPNTYRLAIHSNECRTLGRRIRPRARCSHTPRTFKFLVCAQGSPCRRPWVLSLVQVRPVGLRRPTRIISAARPTASRPIAPAAMLSGVGPWSACTCFEQSAAPKDETNPSKPTLV